MATAGGSPTVLVDGEKDGPIQCVALDRAHVYFTRYGTWTKEFEPTYHNDGSIHRVPLSGGAPVKIASGQNMPHGVIVRGDFVYWHNDGDGAVVRAPRDGGRPTVLVPPRGTRDSFRVNSMAADDEGLYWLSGRKVWMYRAP